MGEPHDSKHEKYAGPSAPALALLEGRVYGFFGGLLGLVGGAALSGTVFKPGDKLVKKFGSGLEHFGLPPEGKVGLVLTSALIGSAVMHRIGNVVGIAVGAKKSGDPEAQFNRTQGRIARLEDKVDELLARPTDASFSEREAARASTSEASLSR
jgi:hypothetical protein